ncbi:MAG: helix-turn-helix domain-containing protein [Tannerella sp.]|jgi:transcriptional regulator with XRE-family HTH domain|nr:helix-turn-helix domain-containing protein [Tannerella sp.]
MSIGSKVKKYREGKGLSQRTLAESIDVSQSIISSIESDKSIPNSVMLNKIAEKLGVDINELLADENIIQNNYDKAIGNIHSQVTINNHFPENILETLLSNQDKITMLLEMQNRLVERLLEK